MEEIMDTKKEEPCKDRVVIYADYFCGRKIEEAGHCKWRKFEGVIYKGRMFYGCREHEGKTYKT